MKYLLTRQAEEDLIQIYLYGLGRFGEPQAEKYHNSFEEEFKRIAKNPEMFPRLSTSGRDINIACMYRTPFFLP